MWELIHNKKYAFEIFGSSDSLDETNETLSVLPSESKSVTINEFNNAKLINLDKVSDGTGEDLELSLDDKIISIGIDQSGSQTWNDPSENRYDLIERFINKSSSTYPGNLYYNLFKFGGKNIRFYTGYANENNNPFNELSVPEDCKIELDPFGDELNRFAGYRIVKNKKRYPRSPLDGEIVFEGIANKLSDTDVSFDQNYYYSIYVFDKNLKFSKGKSLKIFPNNNDIPNGLDIVEVEALKGSGAFVDDSVLGVWHMDEGKGDSLFDFSGKSQFNLNDHIWLAESEVPVGLSGLRFYGNSISVSDAKNNYAIANTSKIGISFWIYPFDDGDDIGILGRWDGVNIDYQVDIEGSSGVLNLIINGSTFSTSSNTINYDTWNYVFINIDLMQSSNNVNVYIDSELEGTGSIAVSPPNLSSADFYLGQGDSGQGRFFITEVALFNETKSQEFILNRYNDRNREDQDNGDRSNKFTLFIPDDADYLSGSIQIRYKDENIYNEFDGELIYENNSLLSGEIEFIHHDKFSLLETYYYRVFTNNGTNFNNINDSALLEVIIPDISQEVQETIVKQLLQPESILGVTYVAGNRKNYIKWDQSAIPSNVNQVRIYHSTKNFPSVETQGTNPISESHTGDLVFSGDARKGKFLHENINNDTTHFYSIVLSDGVFTTSESYKVSILSKSDNDETDIPIKDIDGISYELTSDGLNLFWELDLKDRTVEGFFDDTFIFFGKVTDEFGNKLNLDNINIGHELSSQFNLIENYGEDVFDNEFTFTPTDENDLYNFSIQKSEDGIYRGKLSFALAESFKNYKDGVIKIKLTIGIPDPNSDMDINGNFTVNKYTYKSKEIKVFVKNPIELNINNRDKQTVFLKKKNKVSSLNDSVSFEKIFYDGIYHSSAKDLIFRTLFSSRDANSRPSVFEFRLQNTNSDFLSGDSFTPSSGFITEDIITTNNNFVNTEIDELDVNGNPTGEKEVKSYNDIFISSTSNPGKFLFYTKVASGGFEIIKKIPVVIKNTLQIELLPEVPVSDGVSKGEQTAIVYQVDPNDPDNISLREQVSDGTPVQWKLTKGDNATLNRPFFSQDTSNPNFQPNDGSVVSFTSGGIAKNIIFGPISNVGIADFDSEGNPLFEEYTISADVVYNGLSQSVSQDIELLPLINTTNVVTGGNFLMEFNDIKEKFYSDGISYAKLTISHNPSSSVTKYSTCFRECMLNNGNTLYELNAGTGVNIVSSDPNLEILHGDVLEEIDPYTGRPRLDTSNAIIDNGNAVIELQDGIETNVYFRLNENNSDQKIDSKQDIFNPCSCLGLDEEFIFEKEITISGSLVSIFDSKITSLIGGGKITEGIPPTILIPEEPLDITLVAKKNNGNIVDGITMDGQTLNELVFDVTFAGLPVPDGTKVNATVVNLNENIISLISNEVATSLEIDSKISSDAKSYAKFTLNGISSGKVFESYIIFSVTYDELGSINRTKTLCISINNTFEDINTSISNSLFSDQIWKYTVGSSLEWEKLNSMAKNRSEHSLVNDGSRYIYAIGGINSTGILSSVERFDTLDNTWSAMESMPTERISAQSIYYNGKIYVFGGYVYNSENQSIEVTRSVEAYDTTIDSWEVLESMPSIDIGNVENSDYGIANGAIEYYNNNIYIISGIKDISEDGSLVILNDRILIYDILSDSWSYSDKIEPEDINNYGRISPKHFILNDNIYIFHGSVQDKDGDLEYLVSAYKYDIGTNSLNEANSDFKEMIDSSYKNAFYHIDSDFYSVQGFSKDSPLSRTIESYDISSVPFESTGKTIKNLPFSTFSSKMSILDGGTSEYDIYIVGGNLSGNDKNIVIIDAKFMANNYILNNKDTLGLYVELKNDANEFYQDSFTVVLKGYVQDKDSSGISELIVDKNLAKYNVEISDKDKVNSNGKLAFMLPARSDDILNEIFETLDVTEGDDVSRYKILLEIRIDSNHFFGKTLLDVTDSSNNISIDITDCISIYNNTKLSNLNIDNTKNLNSFSLLPKLISQKPTPSIDVIDKDLFINNVEKINSSLLNSSEAISLLNELGNNQSFGSSPLYDLINEMSKDLSKTSNDSIDKKIYIFTDHEENFSFTTKDQAINSINAIELTEEVPSIITSININDNDSVSYFADDSELLGLNEIAYKTSGHSLVINDYFQSDNLINTLSGIAKGSLGYGFVSFEYDFGEEVIIEDIIANYDLYDNTDGYWNLYYSFDGQDYELISSRLDVNEIIDFDNFKTRYLKFEMVLYSGLSSSSEEEYEDIPSPFLPSIEDIKINYIPCKNDFIYLNSIDTKLEPSQVVMAIETNSDSTDEIEVKLGASTSGSSDWSDFNSESKPSVMDGGKVIIPIRRKTIQGQQAEPLTTDDKYLFKTLYGPWPPNATVSILDVETGNIIDSSLYKLYPRKGIIVFEQKQEKDLKLFINHTNQLKVAANIVNKTSNKSLTISGIGYLYNHYDYVFLVKVNDVIFVNSSGTSEYLFDGSTDTRATYIINDTEYISGNVSGSFVWDINGNSEHVFSVSGETISINDGQDIFQVTLTQSSPIKFKITF